MFDVQIMTQVGAVSIQYEVLKTKFLHKQQSTKQRSRLANQLFLKSYSNELFLFQLTNDLCTSFTQIVITLFLNKAVFIKKNFLFLEQNIEITTTIKVLF